MNDYTRVKMLNSVTNHALKSNTKRRLHMINMWMNFKDAEKKDLFLTKMYNLFIKNDRS